MLTVTDKAAEVIKDVLKDKDGALAIRITLSLGCSGPALSMALDEPKDDDQVFEEKGTKYVIEKTIYDQAKPISVDFVETPRGYGFQLTSSLAQPAGGGCGSCSC